MRKLSFVILGVVIAAALFMVAQPDTARAVTPASHGVKSPAHVLPAHGSIWMGSGLDRFETTVSFPPYGSIWMGNGLKHYEAVTAPVHGSVWFGEGLNKLAQFGN